MGTNLLALPAASRPADYRAYKMPCALDNVHETLQIAPKSAFFPIRFLSLSFSLSLSLSPAGYSRSLSLTFTLPERRTITRARYRTSRDARLAVADIRAINKTGLRALISFATERLSRQ